VNQSGEEEENNKKCANINLSSIEEDINESLINSESTLEKTTVPEDTAVLKLSLKSERRPTFSSKVLDVIAGRDVQKDLIRESTTEAR